MRVTLVDKKDRVLIFEINDHEHFVFMVCNKPSEPNVLCKPRILDLAINSKCLNEVKGFYQDSRNVKFPKNIFCRKYFLKYFTEP